MVMNLHNRRSGRVEQNGSGGNLTPGGGPKSAGDLLSSIPSDPLQIMQPSGEIWKPRSKRFDL